MGMVRQKGKLAMSIQRILRPGLLAATLLGLAGCVGAPAAINVPPGSIVLSQQCFAGFYQCVLPQAGPIGSPCSCPGLGAPSFGSIR